MPFVTHAQIEDAKQMDLLTYLQTCEPKELVRLSDNVYTTRTHDSLKISHGKWCWWSRGVGGRSALDYLIKVRGMPLPDAVHLILGQTCLVPYHTLEPPKPIDKPKRLLLPEPNEDNQRAIAYLASRGIHRDIVNFCIQTGRLFESRDHHNAVFVGFDPKGLARYGAVRGTGTTRYIGDVAGSDKRYSFSIQPKEESRSLHLFESAIDLLSYGTMELLTGRDWRQDHLLSLAGVYRPKSDVNESTPPAALVQYFKDHPSTQSLTLHLDNDLTGRVAARTIITLLAQSYSISDEPPKRGKDMNDCLRQYMDRHRPWHEAR